MTYSADATEVFQRRNRSFQSVSGYFAFSGPDNLKLKGNGQPLPVTGLMVGGNFFQTLGIEPSLGRLFTAEECLHNSRPVVLLSHAFWKRQYRRRSRDCGTGYRLERDARHRDRRAAGRL